MKALLKWTGSQAGIGSDYDVGLDFGLDPLVWEKTAKRAEPVSGQIGGLDNLAGYPFLINIQGILLNGADHYALRPIQRAGETGLEAVSWWDDRDDVPVGERRARVWTLMDLDYDPNLGGAINTRQSQVVFAEGQRYLELLARPPRNTIVRPWVEFDLQGYQTIARHGIWVPDSLAAQHYDMQFRTNWGWRHWVDHLPDNEVDIDGRGRRTLKVQRELGRWNKAQGTITYYQRNTDRANAAEIYLNEDALELTTAAAVTESVTTDATIKNCWAFTSPANEPNSADWPNGTFRSQLDCTAASAGLIYGNAGFNRLDSATNSLEFQGVPDGSGDSNDFSGTGLKLSTVSWNPLAGAATDRFAFYVQGQGDSHGDAITLELNTADSFADGPWTAALPPGLDGTMAEWSERAGSMTAVLNNY